MNNNIEELRCSFEVSKILKEKGFILNNKDRQSFYKEKTMFKVYPMFNPDGVIDDITMPDVALKNGYTDRPTIQMAVEWIRLNFDIWISLYWHSQITCGFHILRQVDGHVVGRSQKAYNSPQEAYNGALLITLNESI